MRPGQKEGLLTCFKLNSPHVFTLKSLKHYTQRTRNTDIIPLAQNTSRQVLAKLQELQSQVSPREGYCKATPNNLLMFRNICHSGMKILRVSAFCVCLVVIFFTLKTRVFIAKRTKIGT